ncbi:MAG: helix-turn-helix transcriptional regulator [Solobacterium sp.]|nr:helix-turn-helix transcriptional regulator [Solobacterium sp.]
MSWYENGYVRKIPDDILAKISDTLNTTIGELTVDDPVYSYLHKNKFSKETSLIYMMQNRALS